MAETFDLLDMSEIDGKVIAMLWISRGPTLRSGFTIFATHECARTSTYYLDKWQILEILLSVDTSDPQYATAEGPHIGVSEKQVRGQMGEPNRVITTGSAHALLYSSGILFEVSDKPGDDYQRVDAIDVRPHNCLKDVPCT